MNNNTTGSAPDNAEIVRRAQDFFCDHRQMTVVNWNPAAGTMDFKCQSCGRVFDRFRDMKPVPS